jgi:hypothetical protein
MTTHPLRRRAFALLAAIGLTTTCFVATQATVSDVPSASAACPEGYMSYWVSKPPANVYIGLSYPISVRTSYCGVPKEGVPVTFTDKGPNGVVWTSPTAKSSAAKIVASTLTGRDPRGYHTLKASNAEDRRFNAVPN